MLHNSTILISGGIGSFVTGRSSMFHAGEIISAITKWNDFVQNRRKKEDFVWPLAIKGLEKPSNRLPPVIPILSEITESELGHLGISSGYRMFEILEKDGLRRILKILQLPIFKEVDKTWLRNMTKILLAKTALKDG